MASIKWEVTSTSTILSTGLNSLADATNAISSEINNTTNLYLFDDVELYTGTFGSAPAVGSVVELYLVTAFDGTNYEDGDATIVPPAANLVGVFNIRDSTSAQRHVIRMIPTPPLKYKYVVINKTGQTFNASGNTLKLLQYRYQTA